MVVIVQARMQKIKRRLKRRPNQKEFCENVRYVSIKNLEDLYDKEGYRDGEFEKGDKGTWTIYTDFAKSNKAGELDSEGMVLHLNRNTRTAKGYYFVRKLITKRIRCCKGKIIVLNLK